jgi:hypothetical protein
LLFQGAGFAGEGFHVCDPSVPHCRWNTLSPTSALVLKNSNSWSIRITLTEY